MAEQQPIIISGAGPVGLTLAEILTQQGIPVMVLEKSTQPSKEWRASTFHAGTLELLESTGLAKELLKLGIVADKVQYRDRTTGLYAEFDFGLLKEETKYPFRLQLPQSTYVKLLNERLHKSELAELCYGTEVTGMQQDEEGVTVTVQTAEGIKTLRTPYLLGADGARSTIRKLMGMPFEGYTLEERFLLVGTPVPFSNYLPDISYVNYISDPQEFLFILKVPEAWRLLYPIPPSVSDEEALSDQRIQGSLQRALQTTDQFPIVERMIYRVHQRVADQFYQGRAVLLGDAAHINSPMGGLGLNSGIHDAVDLGRRMVRIIQGQTDPEAELTMYSQVRRKVAIEYVKQITEKNTSVLTEKDPEKRVKMQQEYAEMANDPVRARSWLLRSGMIASVREQGIGNRPDTVATDSKQ
ncbi:NAD(P)/FAD-dependent oxidoreductase [Brevibacillus nitrificans]|uniref:FAD-dependent oxidoreductase n=1 Tax=Brevibacillus nitrificans TaxID=651560 RepID=UPI002E1DBCD3|nr:NAD(P)/FAD-dependent oxidoreductase [Brevibacillus nitrificans]